VNRSSIGTRLVLGLVLAGVGLAMFAVWFQWGQTRRCLDFFGSAAARRIQTAPRVELWSLAAEGPTVRSVHRLDVSEAPGIVHLRRGLIEDVNYRWEVAGPQSAAPLPAAAWDQALAFFDTADSDAPATVVAFDLNGPLGVPDDSGHVPVATVVGRAGRVPLGPIAPGLRRWIGATKIRFEPEKSGF
jgi:hypothetical protein